MKKFVFVILILLTVASTQAADNLTIVSSARSGLSLTVDFDHSESITQLSPNQQLVPQSGRIQIPDQQGYSYEARVVCFLIPKGAKTSLSRKSSSLGPKLSPDRSLATVSIDPGEIRLDEPVSIRGLTIGKLIIPIIAQQGDGLHFIDQVDVEIRFEGSADSDPVLERGHFSRMLAKVIVNWDDALTWHRKKTDKLQNQIYNPFAMSPNWIRITTKTAGIYKITRTNLSLAGTDVSTINPTTFRLFSIGGKRLPVANSAPRDSLVEIAISVIDDDGIFAGDDCILFYGTGPDFWEYNQGLKYHHHPYSDYNVYYLTYAGSFTTPPLRMDTVAVDVVPPDSIVTSFIDHIHLEDNNFLGSEGDDIFDYFNWYWKVDPEFTLYRNLPEPTAAIAHQFRVKAYAGDLSLSVNDVPLEVDSVVYPHFYYFTTDRFSSDLNQFDFTLEPNIRGATLTDYLEIYYHRALTLPESGELFFYAPEEATGLVTYQVEGQFNSPYLLDITAPRHQRIIESNIDGSSLSFATEVTDSSGRVFALVNSDKIRTPFSIVKTEIDDIRSPVNSGELVFITHDNFYNQSLEYAAYRQSRDDISTRVVKISDVYAQFSGGLCDPVAIRDFLRHAFLTWTSDRPAYVLLVGDGVNDFRDYLGVGAVNYIPPYIVDSDSTISDENFVYFDQFANLDSDSSYSDNDRGVDAVIARWMVKSVGEFQTIADKMKTYELSSNFGSWRNLITLIADDENHPNHPPEWQHTSNSEQLATGYIPDKFDINKIYAIDYPFGTKGEKPEVNEAIIRLFNSGTLLMNYVGHGNPNVWADEHIFRRIQDIPRLNNYDRLTLIFNASCSMGFFDDPLQEGMAEELLRYAKGGVVGMVSATRLVFSLPNASFNNTAFSILLGDNDFTIAEAVYVTKFLRPASTNDRKYIYAGDPMTRLGFAPLQIELQMNPPDSFIALTVTELSGIIKDQSGNTEDTFNGTVTVRVFDDERQRSHFISQSVSIKYAEYGPEIYRGYVDVVSGEFDLKFVVPKDITYGGTNARISCYATDNITGATGFIAPIAIGSINKDVSDTVGPEIQVYFSGDPGKSDDARVNRNELLTIELFDSLGINLTGEIGHAIEMMFDDDQQYLYSLTDSFVYAPGSYQSGSASIRLPDLSIGEHQLKVRAWDSANNSSQKEIAFNITVESGLEISDMLCYPNPVSTDCQFSYVLSESAAEVSLKIFTISGIEIYSTNNLPGSAGYNGGVFWDGRDADGDRIANGVYLFQIAARHNLDNQPDSDDNSKVASTGKLIIMK